MPATNISVGGSIAGLATILFGRAGTQLLPMLRRGKEGLVASMEEAKRLGLVMSGDDAKSAAELTDAMTRLKSTLEMVWVQVGASIAEMLTKLAERIAEVAGRVSLWVRENKPLLVTLFKIGVAVAAAGSPPTPRPFKKAFRTWRWTGAIKW